MRHTACQLANRLHLLALDKLRLKRFELGGIAQHSNEHYLTLFHGAVQGNLHKNLAILTPHAQEFRMHGSAPCGRIVKPICNGTAQSLHHVAQKGVLAACNTQKVTRRTVGELNPAVPRNLEQGHRQIIEKRPAIRLSLGAGDPRQQEHLAPSGCALQFDQQTGYLAVGRVDLIHLPRAQWQFRADPVQCAGALSHKGARREIHEKTASLRPTVSIGKGIGSASFCGRSADFSIRQRK